MIKKAKSSILSRCAVRLFVAGVGIRPRNERKRDRKRHCPRAREKENGFQVFSYLATLFSRFSCRQLSDSQTFASAHKFLSFYFTENEFLL